LPLFAFAKLGYSETAADIRVLQALYGIPTAQIDVTATVQSHMQSGKKPPVDNHLFGKDPAFGKG
jgi:hypothetical protein